MQLVGDDLVQLTAPSPAAAQTTARVLRAGGRWLDVVAGIDSVVVQFDSATTSPDQALAEIDELLGLKIKNETEAASRTHVVPVSFDEADALDLVAVCQQLKVSKAAFIELLCQHSRPVEMLGFTPGFAYIGDFAVADNVSRLKTPKTFVEAGSIGVAGGRIGLYSLGGPGGWPIIGRTRFKLFDPGASEPFTLQPGDQIQFEPQER